jgi:hypothetical protein
MAKHIINKIENGIIMPSSVVSSYANTVKQVTLSNNTSEDKEISGGCLDSCTKYK